MQDDTPKTKAETTEASARKDARIGETLQEIDATTRSTDMATKKVGMDVQALLPLADLLSNGDPARQDLAMDIRRLLDGIERDQRAVTEQVSKLESEVVALRDRQEWLLKQMLERLAANQAQLDRIERKQDKADGAPIAERRARSDPD